MNRVDRIAKATRNIFASSLKDLMFAKTPLTAAIERRAENRVSFGRHYESYRRWREKEIAGRSRDPRSLISCVEVGALPTPATKDVEK